ncbi:MAG: DUF58 domain-containing protein [Verrucomicrobia bacterium]|nr:DUF58 domain-containing protein [Verrucomicrobiota bacterium]
MLPDSRMLRVAARQAAACAERMRLPLRTRVWQGAAGELAGAGTGVSMDFQDHRPYFPGDDPRHINWQAYARTGQYTMKLYREEVRPSVDILFDASPSMFLTPEKAQRSAELLHFVFECAQRAGAGLSIHLLRAAMARAIEPSAVAALRWVDELPAADAPPNILPDLHPIHFRSNGLRILISDLLFTGDPAAPLRALGQGHGSGIILCPFAPEEAAPDWAGPCDFLDVESGCREARQIDAGVLRRYRTAYDAHFQLWKEQTRRFRTPMARIACTGPLETALATGALPAGTLETGT